MATNVCFKLKLSRGGVGSPAGLAKAGPLFSGSSSGCRDSLRTTRKLALCSRFSLSFPGYGNTVVIDHGAGFSTLYGHLHAYSVKLGELVQAGQEVGKLGSTGLSTGPHLHFEIRVNGIAEDPLKYLS